MFSDVLNLAVSAQLSIVEMCCVFCAAYAETTGNAALRRISRFGGLRHSVGWGCLPVMYEV